MHSLTTVRVLSVAEAALFAPEQVVNLSRQLSAAQHQLELFKQQLDWFKRQLFGQKSERRVLDTGSVQLMWAPARRCLELAGLKMLAAW